MANLSSWQRRSTVQWITISNAGVVTVSGTESNIKRIQVTIRANGVDVLTRQTLVTKL
jgi:hypothetical protein